MSRRETYVGLDVEVLEVERVLPDVDADDGDVGEQGVLVRGGGELEALGARVEAEPAPAGALHAGRGVVHCLLERCNRNGVRQNATCVRVATN